MYSIPFRLVIAGDPQHPVRVFPVWEECGEVRLLEGDSSEPLPVASLAVVTHDELPEWLLQQDLPLALTPIEFGVGDTETDAALSVYQAAERVARGATSSARQAA